MYMDEVDNNGNSLLATKPKLIMLQNFFTILFLTSLVMCCNTSNKVTQSCGITCAMCDVVTSPF